LCPDGKELKRTRQYHKDPRNKQPRTGRRKYRASKMVCSICPAKDKCCPKVDARSVTRERFEEVREFARQCTASEFNPKAQARRKKVEMLFAHLKRILGLGRLRLRGPCGVQDEFTLAATAQNLRKLAKLKPLIPATG
ncbi:transposase, partial [Ruegeria sp. Alg231-54]|uniref:transposase n=1 Tax=Ruegeria sp. Alg231-54 TaxID=1922221 RepID=UPI001901A451